MDYLTPRQGIHKMMGGGGAQNADQNINTYPFRE